ncbi:MAG: tryptophanase [Candidatus Gastranaerophilaceae bacterium]|nr:tryptophanase [Christensenellales bacterium]
MTEVKYYTGKSLPLEMHKICVVQKADLLPVENRVKAIREAGFNSYRLTTDDLYLDMLTDSGVNAMSNEQLGAMMRADECYAGSKTYKRLCTKIKEIFNKDFFLPVHQGRACEHMLAMGFVKPGSLVPMNFYFGTALNQIKQQGGSAVVLISEEGLKRQSEFQFKGNFDLEKLRDILDNERERIAFVRIEAGTNLIGGQPVALQNMLDVTNICREYGVLSILDASLLQDNLHFIKVRERPDMSIREITRTISDATDIIYFSARKLGFGRGGAICLNDTDLFRRLEALVSKYEGFPTYGGMSVREMEAITVGLDETMDEDVISQGPNMIEYLCTKLQENGIPVVTPPGGLGCHIDAELFVPHIPLSEYPAGSLASAIYIASGARGMERGGIDEPWEDPNVRPYGFMELVRLAVPRRVYTVSQMNYLADRITWLKDNRAIIGGLRFAGIPPHNFYDKLESVSDWPERLAAQFRRDFGESL